MRVADEKLIMNWGLTCHSVWLEWMDIQIVPVRKELIAFIATSSSSTQSMVSGGHLHTACIA